MKLHSPNHVTLASAAQTLTDTYADIGNFFASHGRDQGLLFINYTKNTEVDCRIHVVSATASSFAAADTYQDTVVDTDSSGVSTVLAREYKLTATGLYVIPIALYGVYNKVQVKATTPGATPGTVIAYVRLDVVQK